MSKYFWFNVSIFILIFASVIILAIVSLTESAGVQLIVIQRFYWSIDKSWLTIRIAAQIFAALAGFIILIFFRVSPQCSALFCLKETRQCHCEPPVFFPAVKQSKPLGGLPRRFAPRSDSFLGGGIFH
jgi:hypothetical protein